MSPSEIFEQGDEATDEEERLNPDFAEEVQNDPTLDPTLMVDDRELVEAGVALDEPAGTGPRRGGPSDDDGWDLDQSLAGSNQAVRDE
ncbi:MAG TPA: hypothetical protein VHV57_17525 [Acidimicrobiales bacterium]|jgi:hypothetical protein|nr:hypothetical protein [Acidimicrobiales bacterium]